jgi:hypothetical protein
MPGAGSFVLVAFAVGARVEAEAEAATTPTPAQAFAKVAVVVSEAPESSDNLVTRVKMVAASTGSG